jgi:hypothetical protein
MKEKNIKKMKKIIDTKIKFKIEIMKETEEMIEK